MALKEPSVLIADSDSNFRTGLGLELKNHGFRVMMAPSGNRAFEFFPKMEFDFIIAEVAMPEGNGHDILARLPSVKSRARVILVGEGELDEDRLAMAGAAAFLKKPFSPQKAIGMIRKLIGAQGKPEESDGTFSYFLNKRRVLTVVSWVGTLGPQHRDSLQKCLRELTAARPKYVILNLHGFTGYDAVLAGDIVSFQEQVRLLSTSLILCGLSQPVQERLAEKGLIDESEIIANLQAALQYLLEIGMKG